MTMDEIREKMAADIASTGRSVLCIFPTEEGGEAFSYSVGNCLKGLPELLVLGMRPMPAVALINELSQEMIDRGRKFDDGEVFSLGGPCPICIVDAAESVKADYTIQAGHLVGGRDYGVMQIVLPDPAGKFPWDEGCAEPYSTTKVMRRLAS
jgi:hypothetical protein